MYVGVQVVVDIAAAAVSRVSSVVLGMVSRPIF